MLDPQEVLFEGDMHLKEQVTQKLRGKGQNLSYVTSTSRNNVPWNLS
jgi:hypothetical protein